MVKEREEKEREREREREKEREIERENDVLPHVCIRTIYPFVLYAFQEEI
jgi:hypothetical protein